VTRSLQEQASRWLATGFGTGFLWPAPGTWGSLLGVALFALFLAPLDWRWQLAASIGFMILGTIAAEIAVLELESDDPSWIVVDEWAGMWLSMVAIQGASGWMLAFFLFRTFDILKPFPAGRFEQLQGGVGIMADDVVAAGYTQVAVHAVLWTFGI